MAAEGDEKGFVPLHRVSGKSLNKISACHARIGYQRFPHCVQIAVAFG